MKEKYYIPIGIGVIIIIIISVTFGIMAFIPWYKDNSITLENVQVENLERESHWGMYVWQAYQYTDSDGNAHYTTEFSYYEILDFSFNVEYNQTTYNCTYRKIAHAVMIPFWYSYCNFNLENGWNVTITGMMENTILEVHFLEIISENNENA